MIVKTTQALVDLTKAGMPNGVLTKVDKLPGQLNAKLMQRFMMHTPGVYFAFGGGVHKGEASDFANIDAKFFAYVVTKPEDRDYLVGPDQIIDVMVPLLHNKTIDGVGTLMFNRVDNLFSIANDKLDARVHAITFEIPGFCFSSEPDLSALNDFARYTAEHSLVEGGLEPEATDNVELDQ